MAHEGIDGSYVPCGDSGCPNAGTEVENGKGVDSVMKPKTMLAKLENWKMMLIAFVALLVVVPSLVNAIADIAAAYSGRFRNPNARMWEKHFSHQPIHSTAIPVQSAAVTYELGIDVYADGDILVQYGKWTKWLPFVQAQQGQAGSPILSLVSTAYAGWSDFRDIVTKGKYVQQTAVKKKTVTRERTYADGHKEILTIDLKTGEVLDRKVILKPLTPEQVRQIEKSGTDVQRAEKLTTSGSSPIERKGPDSIEK